jgi:hypothetical protein
MSEHTPYQFTLRLDKIEHLFVAPEFNPFSDQEVELLGQPALLRVIQRLEPGFVKHGRKIHLTVQLPPDQFTPDLKVHVDRALGRYCEARIADNDVKLRRMRWNGLRSLPSAIAALGICLALSALFLSNTLTFLSNAVNQLLGQGFGIISWVVLWHPVEVFLYDPLDVRRESSVLRYLMTMDIAIEPQPAR